MTINKTTLATLLRLSYDGKSLNHHETDTVIALWRNHCQRYILANKIYTTNSQFNGINRIKLKALFKIFAFFQTI